MSDLLELAENLRESARLLDEMADANPFGPERLRLHLKAEGIRFAVGRCEEAAKLRAFQ